ncbi:MAG: flagellar FlbD family protein, partial [Dehalococcoidia bacterium]
RRGDRRMIMVTRLDGSRLAVNADMVKFVEATPDTIITLSTEQKLLVQESVQDVVDCIIAYKRGIFQAWLESPPPAHG